MSKMPKMNWTPEPSHRHRPERDLSKLAWSMWLVSMALLVAWIASVALAGFSAAWTILLLGMFVGLNLATLVLGFRYVDYLEPWLVARDRILGKRDSRASQRHPVEP